MKLVHFFYHYDDRVIARCFKIFAGLFGISTTIKDVTSMFDLPSGAFPWVILLSPAWRVQQFRIWIEKLNYLVDNQRFYDVRILLNGRCDHFLGEYLIGCGAKVYQYDKAVAILATNFLPRFQAKAVEQTERLVKQIETFIIHKQFGEMDKAIHSLDKIVPWLGTYAEEKKSHA